MKGRRESLLTFVSVLFSACLSAQTLTEFTLPEGVRAAEIVAGPDGNVWFAGWNFSDSRIGRITRDGNVSVFPSAARAGFSPVDIAAGPDGNVWITYMDLADFGALFRVRPSGDQTEFGLRGSPTGVTAGPDGNIWVTQVVAEIARMTPAGQVTYFPIPDPGMAFDIAPGSDGNLWFTYFEQPRIGRITPAGDVTVFQAPTHPRRIASGPDGNLWFTAWRGNKIGRITTAGVITEFPIPGQAGTLVAAPDGNLWFTYVGSSQLGRIAPDGTLLADVPIPDVAWGLAVGSDGNLWFTEPGARKIGRIEFARAPAIDSRILPVVGSTVGIRGSFFRTSVQLHNATNEPMSGRIVFHRSGISGDDSSPALTYSLVPGQTQSLADLLPAMGHSGIGSADIEVTAGQVPTVTVRVFNDAGSQGTTGFTEEPMRAEDALRPEVSGALLVPADPTRFRFNLGVRTLETESTATLTVRDAAGAVVETISRDYPATYHEQRSAGEFLGVSTLPAGGSIGISMVSGSAIFYGATVDNTTGDPSLQVARPAPLR